VNQIPIIKGIFTATKQISEVFLKDHRTAFQKVVLFEYPRRGLYSLGFVTHDDPNLDMLNVFLPTTPNPTSGYLLLVPRNQATILQLSVEEGIRLIISGGSVMTHQQGHLIHNLVSGGSVATASEIAPAIPASSHGAEDEVSDEEEQP
jgi:uncharacterized membrane protein